MTRPPRITAVEPMGGHRLRLTFSDELVRELDFGCVLVGGAFSALEDEAYFGRVKVDEVSGTISWPNGVDLDPDVLHGDHQPATGPAPMLLREYRLHSTS